MSALTMRSNTAAVYGSNNMKVSGISRIISAICAVLFYGMAILFCSHGKEAASRTYIALSEPFDSSRAEVIFREEGTFADPIGFCFWGDREAVTLHCAATGSHVVVNQTVLSGNPGLMDAPSLWQGECYLDSETAWNLFSTEECREQTVSIQDVIYKAVGTISAWEPTMVSIAGSADGSALEYCVLAVTPEKGKLAAQQFLLRWDLAGTVISFYPLWVLVRNLLLIVPGIVTCHLFFHGRKLYKANPGIQCPRSILEMLAGAFLLLLVLSNILYLPDMFPSRRSDFSFWGNWWAEQRENLQNILMTPVGLMHLQMMLNMVKSILSSTAAIFLTLWTFRRRNNADTAD